ncbi:MAG TPA: hypothetical protein PKD09_25680 [Aggregatilinea sp.]|jgi:hypothetical protein|uniref:hypothetical protein n=1 Tax=Aggregatilinea sp. TaxID=2806333 RepID=UPI002BC81FC3|nr:hypothetical protein [Aggregatilinea sp.]HML25069.1 hypothetical protein [Aggregatilinea sp.]
MNETERDQLAQRLSAMSWKDARKEMRRIDPDAVMKLFRNSYHDEYRTLYLMPNQGISVTLVEKQDADVTDKPVISAPGEKKMSVSYDYVGARVAPLERPVSKFLTELA